MKLTIELHHEPELGCDPWFVKVQELPGCMSQGATMWEALDMIQEALILYLEVVDEDGELDKEKQELLIQLLSEPSRAELDIMATQ